MRRSGDLQSMIEETYYCNSAADLPIMCVDKAPRKPYQDPVRLSITFTADKGFQGVHVSIFR